MSWLAEEYLLRTLIALHETHLGPIAALLAENGMDVGALRPDAEKPLLSSEIAKLHGQIAARLSRHVALDQGQEPLRPFDWRVFLYCMSGARTLRDALDRAVDCFAALDGRLGRMTLHSERGVMQVRLDSLRKFKTIATCAIDLTGVVQLHGLFGWLIDGHLPPTVVALDYNESSFAEIFDDYRPVGLRLNDGWTGFAFPVAYLDYPVVRDGEQTVDWARHSFLSGFALHPADNELAGKIRRMMIDSLRQQRRLPQLDQIVTSLGIGHATVRRRLADSGTSYREIKSSCRREVALDLLRQPELTVEDIAARLDFCDSDAFREAFHSWLGTSPSQYRSQINLLARGNANRRTH